MSVNLRYGGENGTCISQSFFVLGTIIYDHKGGVGRGFGMHTPLAFFLGMYMELFFGAVRSVGLSRELPPVAYTTGASRVVSDDF